MALYRNNDLDNRMHPAESLWRNHHPPFDYPPGVVPVPTPIAGIAFFPGGLGLWRPDISDPLPAFPFGGVMVLGHDFHSEAGYTESLARTRESETQPTWRQLLKLLAQVDIKPTECFFTNAYLGLRAGINTTGPFPGAISPPFVSHCLTFLRRQLAVQRPSLVLTLGINVPPLIGQLAPQLELWTQRRGLKHLDAVGPVQLDVRFDEASDHRTNVVALTHPSLRDAGVRHRRYRGAIGHFAEVQMIADARAHAA